MALITNIPGFNLILTLWYPVDLLTSEIKPDLD